MSIRSTGLGDDEVSYGGSTPPGPRGPLEPLPKYATIPNWCRLSGMGRTVTYEAIALKKLRAVKLRNRTLIDVEHGLAYMATLPTATITTGLSKRAPNKTGRS